MRFAFNAAEWDFGPEGAVRVLLRVSPEQSHQVHWEVWGCGGQGGLKEENLRPAGFQSPGLQKAPGSSTAEKNGKRVRRGWSGEELSTHTREILPGELRPAMRKEASTGLRLSPHRGAVSDLPTLCASPQTWAFSKGLSECVAWFCPTSVEVGLELIPLLFVKRTELQLIHLLYGWCDAKAAPAPHSQQQTSGPVQCPTLPPSSKTATAITNSSKQVWAHRP